MDSKESKEQEIAVNSVLCVYSGLWLSPPCTCGASSQIQPSHGNVYLYVTQGDNRLRLHHDYSTLPWPLLTCAHNICLSAQQHGDQCAHFRPQRTAKAAQNVSQLVSITRSIKQERPSLPTLRFGQWPYAGCDTSTFCREVVTLVCMSPSPAAGMQPIIQ